jgi:hypothetical protein
MMLMLLRPPDVIHGSVLKQDERTLAQQMRAPLAFVSMTEPKRPAQLVPLFLFGGMQLVMCVTLLSSIDYSGGGVSRASALHTQTHTHTHTHDSQVGRVVPATDARVVDRTCDAHHWHLTVHRWVLHRPCS